MSMTRMFDHRIPTYRRKFTWIYCLLLIISIACVYTGCAEKKEQVVVYTSVDRIYSEPILKDFQEMTGIEVLPVYDVEANKTTGLFNRLVTERNNPRADVFWNGEIMYTLKLKEQGLLAKYTPKGQEDLPLEFFDQEGYWTAFGGRARVFIVNRNLLTIEQYPESIHDLTEDDVDNRLKAIANPVFGTTASHMAAIYAHYGEEKAYDLFNTIAHSDINIVDGNGVVRDLVGAGRLAYGLTDTDDALSAINKGLPVAIVFPDQEDLGTLVIPNSVGLIAEGPHSENGQRLIDYLLSEEAISKMVASGWCQVSVRDFDIDYPIEFDELKLIPVTYQDIEAASTPSIQRLIELFQQ